MTCFSLGLNLTCSGKSGSSPYIAIPILTILDFISSQYSIEPAVLRACNNNPSVLTDSIIFVHISNCFFVFEISSAFARCVKIPFKSTKSQLCTVFINSTAQSFSSPILFMPVSNLIWTFGLIPVLSKACLHAFKWASEKIEIDILFSVAISNDQTGTAPTTRISQLMFSFRKSNPSSIDATPNISIPDANIIGADIIEPWP